MRYTISSLIREMLTADPAVSAPEIYQRAVEMGIVSPRTNIISVGSALSKIRAAEKAMTDMPITAETSTAETPTAETPTAETPTAETPEERDARIRARFEGLDRIVAGVISRDIPACIISGPPGLGKSYAIELALKRLNPDTHPWDSISGTISAPGLICALWDLSDNGVLVLDDCDDVFNDETLLNILKAVLDSGATRRVSYRKLAKWMEDMGIPQSFDFNGAVVFCSNLDFEALIARNNRMSKHFAALMDRSLYLDLTLRTREDFLTRIHQVAIDDALLTSQGVDQPAAIEIVDFIETNAARFHNISLRLVLQIAALRRVSPDTWRADAEMLRTRAPNTCLLYTSPSPRD